MDVMLLRLLMDASFFMAIFNPLISGDHAVIRLGLMAVLAVWLVWILLNWKRKDLEGRVYDVTITELKAMAVIQIYEMVIQGITAWQKQCAPYVVVFMITAILFLRAGRLVGGSQEKKRFWGANGVELLLILGGVVVFSSDFAKSTAWKLISGAYMSIVLPILMLFLNLLQLVFMLLEPLLALLFSGVDAPGYEVEGKIESAMDILNLSDVDVMKETPLWTKILGTAALVVVFAIIFYFLYKKLSVSGSGKDRTIQGEVKKTALAASERKTEKRHSVFEEKNVRHYYRKFLGLSQKYGLQPEQGIMTTEVMRKIAVSNWGEEESVDQITDLYREVRYGGRSESDEEKKTAKSIFKKMKTIAGEKMKN